LLREDRETEYHLSTPEANMIINLQIGSVITPTRTINSVMIQHWKYAKECANIYGGLMPGSELAVAGVSTTPGAMWVAAQIPGRDPAGFLKIAGEEFAHNFKQLR
jgi:hypothetical protein